MRPIRKCYVTLGLTIKIVSLLMSLTGELLQLFYKKVTDVQSQMVEASYIQTRHEDFLCHVVKAN